MAGEILKRDENRVTVLAGVTNDADLEITMLRVDPITKRLLIAVNGSGGTVTDVTATLPITSSMGDTPNISTSMATNKLIGRGTAGTGVMEEITLGTNLSLTGTTLNASGGGGGIAIGNTVTSGTGGSVLFIDGSGNLAQDNTSFSYNPTSHTLSLANLEVSHSGGGTIALFRDSGTGNSWIQVGNSALLTTFGALDTATSYFYTNGNLAFYALGSQVMILDSGGLEMVVPLNVVIPASAGLISNYSTTGTGNSYIRVGNSALLTTFGALDSATSYLYTTGNLDIYTGGSQHVRIDANGNVGIGVFPSASKLAVAGLPTSAAGLATGDIWIDTTGGLNILKIV